MRLALFQKAGSADVLPGLITQGGVVSVADLVSRGPTPQLTMTGIIDDFERLRPDLERRARDGDATSLDDVRLRAPLPRPGPLGKSKAPTAARVTAAEVRLGRGDVPWGSPKPPV